MKNIMTSFITKESLSGILLFIATLAAIIVANSSLGEWYYNFWHIPLGITFGETTISMTLTYWIDDGLMALFFLMVGLEIKRELLYGELSSFKKASLPIFAALGGMVVPAFIYFIFNTTGELKNGFGIPMATDIAFALGILMLLGKRIPLQLKVFLVSLAVVDDLGAVIVIALFYTNEINMTYLYASCITLLVLFIVNKLHIKSLIPYIILGHFLWFFVHGTGVHATIAGVLLAMFIPIKSKLKDENFFHIVKESIDEFIHKSDKKTPLLSEKQYHSLHHIEEAYHNVQSPLGKLEHALHGFSAFFIMPLFAFSNAGFVINLDNIQYPSILTGIILGLVIGKPIGIVLFSYIAIKLNIASMPEGVNKYAILGAGLLAGIGFTMSIFIAHLAFTNESMIDTAKLAILIASFIASILGVITLIKTCPKQVSKISQS